jgi:hypothetical protein
MATSHGLITLSNTTATRLTPNGMHSGMDITIQNINATGVVYIGGNDSVSSSDFGYRLSADHAIAFELPGTNALYAIAENDEAQIAILKTGLESGS